MKEQLNKIKIKHLAKNYQNNQIKGVFAMDNKLNVRPPYQREFIYDDKKRNEVIKTILNGYTLGLFYWSKNKDKSFEVLDGQQRSISFLDYIKDKFAVDFQGKTMYFKNLSPEIQSKILNYEILVFIYEGTQNEKLNWFQVINIAGEKLTPQELRNAIYSGPFVEAAKLYFSKPNSPAGEIGENYLKGKAIRQEVLETALKWIALHQKTTIEGYMSKHQYDDNCIELIKHFNNIINWVKKTFIKSRKQMKSVDWGTLYIKYWNFANFNDITTLNKKVDDLMADEEVKNKKGIYYYVFDGNEKHLNLRVFDESIKTTIYEKQNQKCAKCNVLGEIETMEADHIVPWSKGGKTNLENCQMLCKKCNREKSDK